MERYSTPQACRLTGVSFRRADYWARIGVLQPSVMDANGSGTQRHYSALDVRLLRVALQMRDADLSLDAVRSMVDQVRALDNPDLADRWLVIVGTQCYVVTDPDSALALLEPGQVAHVLRPAPLRELALA